MECDNQELWKGVRPHVAALGPLRVLRAIVRRGRDVEPVLLSLVETDGGNRILRAVGKPTRHESDAGDAALSELWRLATSRARLSARNAAVADALALRIFELWAEDDPGGVLVGSIVESFGKQVAKMLFDSGVPGSGQSLSAWQLGEAIFLTGDDGAFAMCRSVAEVLADWLAFAGADITCRGLSEHTILRLRASSHQIAEGEHQVRINGAAWTVGEDGSVQSGEMESVVDCAQLLVRDPVVIRAFKKVYPTDGARRVKRLRDGDSPTDDELELLEDLIRNEGRVYLTFRGKGADYDEDDPSDVDLYEIDVRGLGGVYFVQGNEFGDSGFFCSLGGAESYVSDHWDGVDVFGPDEIRPPFGEKKKAKKKAKRRAAAAPRRRE